MTLRLQTLALCLLTMTLTVPQAAIAKRHVLKTDIDDVERTALMYAPEHAGSAPLVS